MVSVAVITRTKDRPKLLERALRSVHSQTFHDFMHVIINDAGDAEVVEQIVASHKQLVGDRVKIIHNKTSNGMEAASNKAIKSVDSTYIAIHDDDDTWHPDFLEKTVSHLEATGAYGVVVRTDKVIEELQHDGSVIHKKTEQWLPDVKAINLYRQCIDNQMTPITFLYRREVFDEVGYYDESLPVCGDWDFGIRFMLKHDVEYLDPGFALANYHHRAHNPAAKGNSSYAGNDKARYYTNLLMNKYLRQELANGQLGVGYIMSKLRYDQSNLATMVRRVLPGFITNRLKKRIQN
ncbi:MAG TPA: glycosyltransferase family 2 protein [Candidatus Saccharimonadales bacterium]